MAKSTQKINKPRKAESMQTNNTANTSQEINKDIQQVYSHAVNLHQKGQLGEAAKLYQMILANTPNHTDSLHYLGVIASQNNNLPAAIELIEKAIQISPKVAAYHYSLGTIFQTNKQFDQALKYYKKTIKLHPKYVQAYRNMAVTLQELNKFDLAKKANLTALRIEPKSTTALRNMGTLMNEVGQYKEAEKYFKLTLSYNPLDTEVRSKQAQLQLLQSDFENGWRSYSWLDFSNLFVNDTPDRLIPFPKWNGASLKGKRLLINADQGVGDEVMFSSYLHEVVKLAKSVVIECDRRLLELYQQSFSNVEIIPLDKRQDFNWHKGLGAIDYKVNLSQLVKIFREKNECFPQPQPYITANTAKMDHWKKRLNEFGTGLNIGISWHGGANERLSKFRSIPLSNWKDLALIPGINLINLQYGEHAQEIETFNQQTNNSLHVFDDLDTRADLNNLSALISSLDLVISIDNSTVHFAGALGTPVWVILPSNPSWRWFLKRRDSLWYDTVKLYRAQKNGFDGLSKQLAIISQDLAALTQDGSALETTIKPLKSLRSASKSILSNKSPALSMQSKSSYALLLNDTSHWYHWGCSCTSIAIHHQLRTQWPAVVSIPITNTRLLKIFPTLETDFDDPVFFKNFCESYPDLINTIKLTSAIYINGEDTLHGLSQTALSLLYLAYIAKTKFNKKVSIINHSCYPDDCGKQEGSTAIVIYQKVYQTLDYIAIREHISAAEIKQMNIPVTQSFDCLPLFIETMYQRLPVKTLQTDTKEIIFATSVAWNDATIIEMGTLITKLHQQGVKISLLLGASANIAAGDIHFVQALNQIIGKDCELLFTHSEQEWLSAIDNAQLLISGRFHHSIAAAFLGTPFIVMESNTPKIRGMLDMLELNNFVSIEQPDLVNCLFQKSLALIENPQLATISAKVKEKTLALARKNFDFF